MYWDHHHFVDAMRRAAEDEEVSPRVRSALAAVSAGRREDVPVGRDERRLWALLASLRAGHVDERAVIDLAVRVARG